MNEARASWKFVLEGMFAIAQSRLIVRARFTDGEPKSAHLAGKPGLIMARGRADLN